MPVVVIGRSAVLSLPIDLGNLTKTYTIQQ